MTAIRHHHEDGRGGRPSALAGRGISTAICVAASAFAVLAPAHAAWARPAVSTTASPVAWAATVCSTISSWQRDADRQSVTLRRFQVGGRAAGAQSRLVTELTALSVSTHALAQSISRAGTPAVESGGAIVSMLRSTVGTVDAGLAAALDKARRLPAARQGVTARARSIAVSAAALTDKVGIAFVGLGATFGSAALNAAFDQVPACERIHR